MLDKIVKSLRVFRNFIVLKHSQDIVTYILIRNENNTLYITKYCNQANDLRLGILANYCQASFKNMYLKTNYT